MKYRILFSIDFLNDYYVNSRSADFDVIPSAQTAALMKGLGVLSKMIANLFVVLIPVDENNKPFKVPLPTDVWKFYVQLSNSRFINFTNTTIALSSRKRYLFHNLNQNEASNNYYISKKITPYNSSNEYLPGDLAANGSGSVFEALKSSSGGNQHPLTETAFWLNRGNKQFVSKDDLIILSNSFFVFETSAPATQFAVKVYKLNITNGLFDIPVLQSEIQVLFSASSIVVNLEPLQPAQYRIEVNGESKFIYYDNTAVYSGVFGIIEIFNHLNAANDFSLFDNTGVVKEKKFALRFANRLVFWKYRARTSDVTSIDDSSSNYVFTQLAPLEFISNRQIPISETPIKTISLNSTKLGKVNALVNPNADRINTIEKDGDTIFCAEVFLNY